MVYGAFEARETIHLESGKEISQAPVFDLTRFVSIFDWMAGVRSFLHHADAGNMSRWLTRSLMRVFTNPEQKRDKTAYGSIRADVNVCRVCRLSRPVEAMKTAYSIQERFGCYWSN